MTQYKHNPHQITIDRVLEPKVEEWVETHPKRRAKLNTKIKNTNEKLALFVTKRVGNMWCAYIFCFLALVSFGQAMNALKSGDILAFVSWLSQTFLQLVLLPVIMVGQSVQSKSSDLRAEKTYKDAEAILHELVEIHKHLDCQDENIASMQKVKLKAKKA